jgi:hypothetical protein
VPELDAQAVSWSLTELSRSGEIVAICRRGHVEQAIGILDLPLPEPSPEGAEWIAAYRHWAG